MIPRSQIPPETSARELAAESAVMFAAAALVYLFGHNTPLMSALIAGLIALRFLLLNRRHDIVFFALGVLLGGGNDLLSMAKGVYAYKPPTILPVPIPLWMVFFWGQIFVAFRKLMRFGPFKGSDQPPKLIDPPLLLDLAVVIIYRIIIYRTASQPWLPDALFAAILAVRLLVIPPEEHERRLMLTILIIGPLYEILLIKADLYAYQTGVFFGMPLWLIVYWVFVIRFLKAVFDRVEFFLAPKAAGSETYSPYD